MSRRAFVDAGKQQYVHGRKILHVWAQLQRPGLNFELALNQSKTRKQSDLQALIIIILTLKMTTNLFVAELIMLLVKGFEFGNNFGTISF